MSIELRNIINKRRYVNKIGRLPQTIHFKNILQNTNL